VFFRLGKLERNEKSERTESPNADGASGAGSAGAAVGAAPSAGSVASQEPVKERTKDKKKARDSGEAPGAAPGGEMRAAAGPARAQAGLSVNDFISKTKNQQRQGVKPSGPELIAYARYLGIDPVADHDLLWIATEALEAPLPSDWTEHFDSNDRVFYYNATTRVSSWTHPLEHVYRETYKTIVNFRNSNMSPPERSEKLHQLQAEVKQMHEDVNREISQWTEHTDEQGNRFYFNREERQSTWTDPRPAKCQILYLRQKMLRLLESNAGATAGFADSKADGLSRFGPIAGRGGSDYDDSGIKRSKVVGGGGGSSHEPDPIPSDARRSPDGRSNPGSDPASDSDSGEDRKAKKRKKKKKKKHGKEESGGIRLGAPQKLGNSASEPSVGVKPLGLDGAGGSGAGGGGGMGRSPRGGPSSGGAGGSGAHPALGALTPLDDSGLSMAGRARVKGGIRLAPLAADAPPPGAGGGAGADAAASSGRGVRNSASVPAL